MMYLLHRNVVSLFPDQLFLNAVHHDKEHRDRIRDITSKKNFGPSKAFVHRFSKANLQSDRGALPPDPRLAIERARRAGLDSSYASPAYNSIVCPGGKPIDTVTVKKDYSVRELPIWNHGDHFNGNTDPQNMPLQSGGRPEEESAEMTSLPDGRHLLSTDENHNSAIDSASLITAYSQEFTVAASEPQKRRRRKKLGAYSSHNDEYDGQRDIGASDYEGYENKGAILESNDFGFGAQPELVPGPSRDNNDALTQSSRLASVATPRTLGTDDKGSIDSTQRGQPLLAKQHFSDNLAQASSGHAGSEIGISKLPPIDSNSSLSSSVLAPQTQSNPYIYVNKVSVIGTPPMGEITGSWASSGGKDRQVSARTKWSDETDTNSVESDMALENCDYSSDASEFYPPEA